MTDAPDTLSVQACIAGGGPAGMMLGYLLARAGVKTAVLEKHADFLRDFRGDTVHPSTLEAMHDLGLLDAFLQRPHSRLYRAAIEIDGREMTVIDLSHLPVACRFVAFMPQWDFLNFLAEEAKKLPAFRLVMQAEATELVRRDDGRVVGLRARTPGGPLEISADLVIGADGRGSVLRDEAGLPVTDLGAPIDVFWFRVSRDAKREDDLLGRLNHGRFIVTIDRGDYWQCAFVIGKGGAERMKAEGIEAFRRKIAEAAPTLASKVEELRSFDDVKLLTVTVDRLERWSKPGLLFIGDAAHAMSPIGGVGINLAVQDAIAAANLLAARLAAGRPLGDHDLDAVRRRRLLPVKIIQGFQVAVQDRLFRPALAGDDVAHVDPTPIEVLARMPLLQRLAARMIGLGVRLERVRSPSVAGPPA
jgi:2-polyprenyl-6-methoxyphenol hydroxylase-like FAD-dependent oxidoreductase